MEPPDRLESTGEEVGVRKRIVWLTVAVASVAIGLFVIPLALVAERFYMNTEVSELERQASSVVSDVSGDVQRGRAPSPAWINDEIDAAVYDDRGVKIAGDGPGLGGDTVLAAIRKGEVEHSDENLKELVVAIPIFHDGDVKAVVRSTRSGEQVIENLAYRYAQIALLAILAVLVTWLLAWRQAAKLGGSVEDLSRRALRLGDGDFTTEDRVTGIPEIDEVRSALNATATRLDALLARERAFSAEASHQLRTPLTGLQLRLEAALRSGRTDHTPAILASLAEVDRLERTITDLLALARGTRQKGILDLNGLLSEVDQVWGPRLGSQQRALRIRVEDDLPPVEASTAAIRQVLTVLMGNAVEHGRGTVTVSVRDIEDAVAIDVADEGSVSEGAGQDLFDRREPDAEGHGIGLALARRLVEAEGGRLQLRSPDPTTLTIFLPVTAPPVVDPGPSTPERGVQSVLQLPSGWTRP
ncbi:ATP-binding protein [Pseudonocardia sp. CA-107938]|uniref:sensor histidine kinase n=1 Tax=Pseudonocardia sp. CA-107938 TaxID=3240021 RepID=UPI003D939E01